MTEAASSPVKNPWESLATRIITTGKINGVTLVSFLPEEKRLRNVLLATSGISINSKDEARRTEIFTILQRISAANLHSELVSFIGQKCVINLVVSMRPGVYLARNVNPATPNGLIIAHFDGAIALATYGEEVLPMDAMSTVESCLSHGQAKRSRGDQ